MKLETLERDRQNKEYSKALPFIEQLVKEIGIEYVDTNDFSCNLWPGVYVHNKENRFKVKVYHAWNDLNIKRAIKFHHAKNVVTNQYCY